MSNHFGWNKGFKADLPMMDGQMPLQEQLNQQQQQQTQPQQQQRRLRVLVSKLGLDGHDRGALVICRALRDAGMEVIYSGLFCTPEQVAKIAIDEDVDAVAMSLLNGAHLVLFPKVARLLKENGVNDVLLVGGGIIPEKDKEQLEKEGITGNFGPGTPLPTIINHISENVKKLRQNR